MSLQSGLALKTHPLTPRSIEAGAPVGATHDLEMAQQTQNLGLHGALNSYSYCFDFRFNSPHIPATTAVNTYYDMVYGVNTIVWPWLAHPNADALEATVYTMVNLPKFDLYLRMKTTTLSAAVATRVGDRNIVQPAYNAPPGLWTYDHERVFQLAITKLRVKPDYTSRIFCVGFQAYWDVADDPQPGVNIGGEVYLHSVQLRDVIDNPEPES